MSDSEETPIIPEHEQEDLDNPLRVIIVVNSPESKEGDMEEKLLDSIQSFEEMNAFFDSFDENIAMPNEEHIKYEVGSDGLVVIIVDSIELRDEALKFMDDYVLKTGNYTAKTSDDESLPTKKAKRS